jgi:hypothetical protein
MPYQKTIFLIHSHFELKISHFDSKNRLPDAQPEDRKSVPNTKSYSARENGNENGKSPLKSNVGSLSSAIETLRMMMKALDMAAE